MATALEQFQQGFKIGEYIQNAPQRQTLANLGLEQQQFGFDQQKRAAELAKRDDAQAQVLQRMQYMNRIAKGLRQIPRENRYQAAQQYLPQLEALGITQDQISQGDFEDAPLDQFIGYTDQLITDPSKLTAAQRQFASLTEGLTPEQKRQAQLQELGIRQDPLRKRELDLREKIEERQKTKLSSTGEKELISAQNQAIELGQQSREFEFLINDFQRNVAKLPGGARGQLIKWADSLFGTQDEFTEFRRRFNKVRLAEGLKYLPPGPATDKDVEIALSGVPDEMSSPEQVVLFLQGSKRLADFAKGYNDFKSDYLSKKGNTKGLNKAWERTKVFASNLDEGGANISVAEIYETAQAEGISVEEVMELIGVTDELIK